MNFTKRFGILIDERTDAARLVSAEILRHNAPGREEDRIVFVDVLGWRTIFDPVKAGLAVRMMELPTFKQPGRSGMAERRTGPEDAHVLFDLGVGHSAVIRHAAFRCGGKVAKNVVGDYIWETILRSKPGCEIRQDLPVHPSVTWRRHAGTKSDTSAFTRCDSAFVFFLQRSRQHDIGMTRGLGKKEINTSEELELVERSTRAIGVWNRNQRIEADRQQAPDFSFFNSVEDFARRQTCVR